MRNKKTLFHSIISLLLCVSMLMGTTFAWFTDSVSTGINTIAAGNLDAELYHSNAAVTNEQVDSSTKLFLDLQGDPILWEPGVVSYENLRITNEGDLALAYQLAINTANENYIVDPSGALYGLSHVLKVGVVEGGITATDRAGVVASVKDANWTTLKNFLCSGSLFPEGAGTSEETWGVVIYWEPGENDNFWNLNNGKQLNEGDMLQIDLGVKLVATQEVYESDSFGDDYDTDAKAFVFPDFVGGSATAAIEVNDQGQTVSDVTMISGKIKVFVPAGVQVKSGVTELCMSVSEMASSGANVSLGENEDILSLDVHIEGIADNNTVPITVTLAEVAPAGLNMGNYQLYHVESAGTEEMTLVDSSADFTAHNQFKYDPATGDIVLYMATFSEVSLVAEPAKWEGKFDYTWYDSSKTELTIANADQLAGFGAIVGGMVGQTQDSFSGKTVKLVSDIDLGDAEAENNPNLIFYPIGYYNSEGTYERTNTAISSGLRNFEGTFDGNGHTIANFYHNTWEMKGDHDWYAPEEQYYRDGMGLFGRVYGGTVKNLTVSNFSSDGEIATTGCIAAYADGATFENIAIFNCNPRVYNIGNGGIVGCVGWYAKEADLKTTFTNITVDNSNKISALWGSYDVPCGGIVGQYYPTGGQTSAGTPKNDGMHFKNCHVSAQMDVYNDVCGNYQYYAYRYAGMLIGSVRENETIDGHVYPNMNGITANDCTVHFGDWNDYYYCELEKNGHPSYAGDTDYKFSRLEQVASVDLTNRQVTTLEDKIEEIPTSGWANYVVVGTERTTCYHFENGQVYDHRKSENNKCVYLEFNNLVTGYGWGVTTKVVNDVDGVEILDETMDGSSVVKFKGKVDELANNKEYKLGDIFNFIDEGVKLIPGALAVFVNNQDENNPVSAEFNRDVDNWENGTLTLTGTGKVQITIQDYYFCTPTTITVNVTERRVAEKFEIVMNNGDFLHRVGNKGTVALDKLFKAKEGITVGTVSVTVEAVNGTAASGTYSNNAIQFSGTGVVKVTIKDDDQYCTPTELYLEVVDAVNATTATSATSNNVVLLNDCGFGSLDVSGGYSLYGNGFTMTCASDSVAIDRNYGFIVLKNGTLDNVNVIVPNFSHAILFDSNKTEGGNPSQTDSNNRTRYYNIRSAVVMEGKSKIANSMISGGRAAVYAANGNATITNSTIKGGAAANIQVERTATVTLNDITLIQKPIKATVHDTTKTLMGMSIVTLCDSDGIGGTIILTGKLRQYAWAREDYKQYVPEKGQSLVGSVLKQTGYTHDITFEDGATEKAVNLGIVFMPDGLSNTNTSSLYDQRGDSEKNAVPYEEVEVSYARVYTYKNTSGTNNDVREEPGYSSNQQIGVMPEVVFSDAGANRVFTTAYDESTGWTSTLKVDLDAGDYTFRFVDLAVKKYGQNLSYTVTAADGTSVDKNAVVTLNDTGAKEYVLRITDNLIYDKDGNLTGKTESKTYTFKILSTKTSIKGPTWEEKPKPNAEDVKNIKKSSVSSDWSLAIPVLKGAVINYWSKNSNTYVGLDLTTLTPETNGKQADGANAWTVTKDGEYTLTITSTVFKTNYAGMPVVYEENGIKTLYYTVNNKNGCLGSGTTSRSITITYEFTDSNNNAMKESVVWDINKIDMPNTPIVYDTFVEGGSSGSGESGGSNPSCVTPDTLITLANGKQVCVDSLTGNEELLIWNMETGKLDSAPILFVDSEEECEYEIIHLYFSDGTDVKVISEHGFWDYDLNKYVYLDRYAEKYIGHSFAKQNGSVLSKVTLTDVVLETEVTTVWSPVTAGHLCYFVNGMLSMPGGVGGLFNIFIVDPDTMTYDFEAMQREIETYGLYTYEELNAICPLSEEMFNMAGGAYLKISIGKGNLTEEELVYMINRYSKFF